ncbi:MAG: PEGA domain-containing protein [Bacteroidetes Order II. Incertae sedis bacterium]|nr:PEGA domain-containing protein [Bacteroidetes Order II. bacterium]
MISPVAAALEEGSGADAPSTESNKITQRQKECFDLFHGENIRIGTRTFRNWEATVAYGTDYGGVREEIAGLLIKCDPFLSKDNLTWIGQQPDDEDKSEASKSEASKSEASNVADSEGSGADAPLTESNKITQRQKSCFDSFNGKNLYLHEGSARNWEQVVEQYNRSSGVGAHYSDLVLECREFLSNDLLTWMGQQPDDEDKSEASNTQTASLTVHSNVQGDKIYINGKLAGSSRLELDLPHGEYAVRIEKDGYQPYEDTISLTGNLIIRGNLENIIEQPAQTASADQGALELVFWQSIKDSDDPDLYKEYLRQFPEGVYAGLAKIKLRNVTESEVAVAPRASNADYGRYHALVIGNNNYEELPDLKTAIKDANRVAAVLQDQYDYNVTLIEDADRSQIIKSLSGYRKTVGKSDNILIYYAGHGILDEDANKGYWLPVDAALDDPSNWILNDMLIAQLKAMQAKHVMVISDSCFSGTITRGLKMEQHTPDWIDRMSKKRARTALTSGGLEPVLDSGGDGHSVFARAFITLLEENTEVVSAAQLFSELRPKVMVNSPQTPEYGNIHQAGHDGGDFLFVKQ